MKLITYNFLTSKAIRGVKIGFPLKLNIEKKDILRHEYNANFLKKLLPKLEWSAVLNAAEILGVSNDIPKEFNDEISDNQEILKKLHHLLLEIDILEGSLECPETGRLFPITDGIPNMLLNEDEV